MSEFTVPSYRVRPQRAGFQVPWRMLALSGAVLGAAAVGGGVVWGISRAVNRTVPTIEADARPIRVKPDDPGGLRVANQDERIFESQRRGGATAGTTARLTPEAERPDVNALRQAAIRAQQVQQAEQARAAAAQQAEQARAAAAQQAEQARVAHQAQAQPAVAQPSATQPAPEAAPSRPPLVNPSVGQQLAARMPAPPPQPAPQAQPAQQQAPAAPPITPPPMPANAPVRGGRFVVQLGAVTSEEAAQGEWARLQGRIPELAGRQPVITRVDRGDLPPMWRIRTGGLPDDKAAQALCTSAKAKGAPCAVIGG
ncbi:SPOR domain-containing protein [Roseomonas populi]|uniref:SPOR domain-containing protein n=1 Tax=Roseomonas populi TaxID=3121582 RepID=A0ABT1X1S0_9PROT|nr:SPOR domain-containing protein [Roseomonas pecuniae]MCR0981348.1 SPOR domain-containing protein [Roseomonas pecuniae]